jgi:diguanylate cyclase (GGDEF)-like protein
MERKFFFSLIAAFGLVLLTAFLLLRFLPDDRLVFLGAFALAPGLAWVLTASLSPPLVRFEGADKLKLELQEKADALKQLQQLKSLLLAANDRLSRRLFESRVMLTIWSEQEKSQDTKEFLSRLLEALLPGLPFDYGCILIRPLAAIGPEMIFARVERNVTTTIDIPVDDNTDFIERTLWISDIDPKVKEFLLARGQESTADGALTLEKTTGSLDGLSPPGEISVLTLTLRQGNDHLGSLHLLSDKPIPRVGSSLQNFLTNVRAQVAVLLQIRALSYAMRVDPLTRLYNRGYLNDRLREEVLRSSRTNHPFTFLLLDVDHFKRVNDTYGHQVGDEVLVGISALLKRSCRASDAICRYGGEEIAIILVDTPLSGAQIFAENLRKSVEAERFQYEGGSLNVTVSMGLAEYPTHASKGDELITRADQALYEAKRSGRNTWRSASA